VPKLLAISHLPQFFENDDLALKVLKMNLHRFHWHSSSTSTKGVTIDLVIFPTLSG